MDSSTAARLAESAGVPDAYVVRLVELGLIADVASVDVATRRVRVIAALERGGIPLETIAAAQDAGQLTLDFVEQPSYGIFASYSDETFAEAAARTGLPVEAVLAVRAAMGFADGSPDDHIRRDELDVLPYLEAQLAAGVATSTIERSLRVWGEAMRRVADTESAWWWNEILEPLFRAGKSTEEIGRLTAETARMGVHGDRALLAIFHGQQAHAWMRNIFEGLERELGRLGLHAPTERLPAICFLDLTGYTRLTEQEGDTVAAETTRRLGSLVQGAAARHGGRAVKWLGDGVMFHFPDAGPAVLAALEMVSAASHENLPPAHVGVHAGPVLFQEGDYFGRTVNVASRVADYARPGEVLVTAEVVAAASDRPLSFTEIGPVELKGLPAPIRLFLAAPAAGVETASVSAALAPGARRG